MNENTVNDTHHEAGLVDLPHEFADLEAGGEVTTLGPPRAVPGRKVGRLSPEEYFVRTRRPARHADGFDEHAWLTTHPIGRVEKKGVRLGHQWYWCEDLMELISGPSGATRKTLYMRYDRALAARGVLREIIIVEQDPQGRFREICRCQSLEEAMRGVDLHHFVAMRHQYLRQMTATRSLLEHEYVRLEAGTDTVEALVNDELARRRRPKHNRDARVATPVFGPAKDQAPPSEDERRRMRDHQLAAFLGVDEVDGGAEADATSSDLTHGPLGSPANPDAASLQELLGGRTRFTADDEDDD